MRLNRLVVALCLAALATASLSVGSVGAYSNVQETGMIGTWYLNDTSGMPGATCQYGPEYSPNYAGLRSMKVKPPVVFAADRNSDKRDHKRIKWYWQLQRAHYPELNWKVIKTSNTQSATAYEDQAAPFSAMTINHNVGNPEYEDIVFRAKVYIKWIKKDGTVEGTAKATIDWYKRKMPWGTSVGGSAWCQKVATSG